MGLEIAVDAFDEPAYAEFSARLREDLAALELLCARPGFGRGPTTIGAELELHLVDAQGRPSPLNRAVLARTVDANATLEIDRFNLELNTSPLLLDADVFTRLASQLDSGLREVRRAAAPFGVRVVPIGILPTLEETDLRSSALTNSHRYRALSAGIRRIRNEPFDVVIEGIDRVHVTSDDVALEGANTSFQVHLRVDPDRFASTFNAAQIATGPVLAATANSPLFLQRRLWDETRIALFRQSVDHRVDPIEGDWRPARVSFGHGWVRRDALELFEENVLLYAPLLPVIGRESPVDVVRAGGVPALDELRLHQGTVWQWNRAVYDAAAGGHFRIEFRALPAGPTVDDMVANAAFMLGLTLALLPDADELVNEMTFGQARRNFYDAARFGLDAELLWPCCTAPSPRPIPARDLVRMLLPLAREALVACGIAREGATRHLDVIARRVERGVTGARWQRAKFESLAARGSPREAARMMLDEYMARSLEGLPVSEW
jgi:gamma-glutamyl:cysteine ligase YbdK (ATP-grasp superfamily)